MSNKKKRVLFLCTHNSARSQMAEGILRAAHGEEYEVSSAGTEPSRVNPYAIRTMGEIGIDISDQSSKNVEQFLQDNFDYVATVCDDAKEACPTFPGAAKYMHKGFSDPSKFRGKPEEILIGFRKVRDDIRDWVETEFDGN